MKLKYERDNTEKFINPYNFVSINFSSNDTVYRQNVEETYQCDDSSNSAEEISSEKKLHTGYINCRIIVKTPLAIPDTEKRQEIIVKDKNIVRDHYQYPFFSVDGEYLTIPGSSIRGVLRSVYEAATNSCFCTTKPDTGLTKRVEARQAYKPGLLILEKNNEIDRYEWKLYSADRYLIPVKGYATFPELNASEVKYHIGIENGERYIKIENEDINSERASIKEEINNEKTNNSEKINSEKRSSNKIIGNKIISNYKKIYNGQEVSFTCMKDVNHKRRNTCIDVWNGVVDTINTDVSIPVDSAAKCGYVYVGEKMKKKHGESIFVKNDSIDVNEDTLNNAINLMEKTIKIYQNASINKEYGEDEKKHSGYKNYFRAKRNGIIPIWYSNDTQHLALAAVGRNFYSKSVNDLLGNFDACSTRAVCKACRLFGMTSKRVGEENGNAIGSRIRVTDAKSVNSKEKMYSQAEMHPSKGNGPYYAILKELGTPRNSYLPFYAKKVNSNGHQVFCSSYDEEAVSVRGRKFYWHNPKAENDKDVYSTTERTNRNGTFELAVPKTEFVFKIYFDRIKMEQIRELIWSINFWENDAEGKMCHKLGHGKPLGLGSVKIVVDNISERIVDDNGYHIKE